MDFLMAEWLGGMKVEWGLRMVEMMVKATAEKTAVSMAVLMVAEWVKT
jgi:hypothetical protein